MLFVTPIQLVWKMFDKACFNSFHRFHRKFNFRFSYNIYMKTLKIHPITFFVINVYGFTSFIICKRNVLNTQEYHHHFSTKLEIGNINTFISFILTLMKYFFTSIRTSLNFCETPFSLNSNEMRYLYHTLSTSFLILINFMF